MRDSRRQGQVVPRLDGVDLLRGFSILSVVLLHARNLVPAAGLGLPEWLRYVVFNEGGNGVSVFFCISGFLITLISTRRFGSLRRVDPRAFYRIRFARIAPPLLLLLLVLSVLHLAGVPEFHIKPSVCGLPRALFAALTFHVNWLEAVHGWLPACWTVLWTLSVEEMFYLVFPLLCLVLLRRRGGVGGFVLLLCGLAVFGPVARTPLYTTNGLWSYQSYLGNVDGIALGCLCAMASDRLSRRAGFALSRWPLIFEALGAAMMLFIVVWPWPRVIFGWHVKHALGRSGTDVTVLYAGTCLVMLGSVLRGRSGSWWTAPVRWFGRHSYEIYLTHEFVVLGMAALLWKVHRGPVAVWVCAMVVLAGVPGYLLARWVSEPMNRALHGAPVPSEL